MPTLTDHQSSEYRKLILIGNSGAGKTGALTSLVQAGFNLRIIDLDSGLDALVNHIKLVDPALLAKIQFQTFRDKMKMTPTGTRVVGAPRAYANTLETLEKWPDDGSDPAEWGKDTVLVIDSLTNLGRAAFLWAKAVNPSTKDPRQWYKTAQDLIEDLLANVTSDEFKTNVIVISHIELTDQNGLIKGYASAIGKALGPKLARFFNTLIISEPKGQGKTIKRMIKTFPTALIDAKNPVPAKMEAEYPIETGLADIFKVLENPTR
jgi:hypothetical protein